MVLLYHTYIHISFLMETILYLPIVPGSIWIPLKRLQETPSEALRRIRRFCSFFKGFSKVPVYKEKCIIYINLKLKQRERNCNVISGMQSTYSRVDYMEKSQWSHREIKGGKWAAVDFSKVVWSLAKIHSFFLH